MIIDRSKEDILTQRDCYGEVKPIVLSWSRLSDWTKCKQRSKLRSQKKTSMTNARNMLAGNVTDHTLRHALEYSKRDEEGRLVSLSLDELMDPLPGIWEHAVNNPERDRYIEWKGDPIQDQKRILSNIRTALKNLHPILLDKLIGKRFLPEFRPEGGMPIIGIPGLDGETAYIRLFLAIDLAIEHAPKQWGVWDLKVSSADSYLTQTLPQLVFYSIAFQALTGIHPTQWGLIAPLSKRKIHPITVTEEHRNQVMNWIITYCHSVWNGEEDLTEDENNCYGCPTKAACPKFLVPKTKDEQGAYLAQFGRNLKGKNND